MANLPLDLLELIDRSFMLHAGYLLPVPAGVNNRYQWLHTQAPYSLLAHDNSDDPKFIYANQQALRCFKYSEEEFIGLPSRFSAAETDRPARQVLLLTVREKGIAGNYTGPRIDKFNQSFTIYDGIVWQICQQQEVIGQAALFWPDDLERPDWFQADR
ncbi:MEKHLA domain-containing protein [Buttiauxella warmboldiae]|uniref:MEKHLA domain-containing protein n=1 Tax=Buttiauxella warmboldiae TaxID=82993 RepID=A0A3N5EAY5_9ENTR|nr:MEKHLA domain-containing protein [Buttiauxella warmboldiae]RPH27802.1 MEKHLA domain-containing protein [Buttiauxella warmboldiae]